MRVAVSLMRPVVLRFLTGSARPIALPQRAAQQPCWYCQPLSLTLLGPHQGDRAGLLTHGHESSARSPVLWASMEITA